jgi:hypothetical protein
MIATRKKIPVAFCFYPISEFKPSYLGRSSMKELLTVTFVFALAGCSNFIKQSELVAAAPPIEQTAPQKLPPTARAEAPKAENEHKGTQLMECKSESCKIKCFSKEVDESQSRPKWCSYFKEPT